jgi:hypothetical protein
MFVGVCEGFLGIPVNWDLWVHLFRAELHTLTTTEPKTRRAVHAGGVTIALWETCREFYIPCTMTSNTPSGSWGGSTSATTSLAFRPKPARSCRRRPIPGGTACRLPRVKTGWTQP